MHKPRSVRDADVGGKTVLVRSDLNVPLEDGRIADETRIEASLPTPRLLLERNAHGVRVCSHLGRPKGPDPAFRIEPVRARMRGLLPDERIEVVENTRFTPGERDGPPGCPGCASPTAAPCSARTLADRSTEPTPRPSAWPSCCRPTRACCSSASWRSPASGPATLAAPAGWVPGGP